MGKWSQDCECQGHCLGVLTVGRGGTSGEGLLAQDAPQETPVPAPRVLGVASTTSFSS